MRANPVPASVAYISVDAPHLSYSDRAAIEARAVTWLKERRGLRSLLTFVGSAREQARDSHAQKLRDALADAPDFGAPLTVVTDKVVQDASQALSTPSVVVANEEPVAIGDLFDEEEARREAQSSLSVGQFSHL